MLKFEIIWTSDRLCWTNNSQDTGGTSGFDGHLSGTVIKPQNMLWIQNITVYSLKGQLNLWHHFITLMSF